MNLDLHTQTQFLLGLWEREIYSDLRAFTAEAKTGIDVGAAEGVFSLYFLSQAKIKRVFAFEYQSILWDMPTNLNINGFGDDPRLMVIDKYVASHTDDNHCTLDSFAAGLEGPCVVKVDVDGGEEEVLRGADKLLDRKDVSWIIETHSEELEKGCVQLFTLKGLTARIRKNAWWRFFIPEGRPIPHNRWLVAWHDKDL